MADGPKLIRVESLDDSISAALKSAERANTAHEKSLEARQGYLDARRSLGFPAWVVGQVTETHVEVLAIKPSSLRSENLFLENLGITISVVGVEI